MSERLLFDAISAIFQLCRGENKLIFTNTLSWIFCGATSLKQQSVDRLVVSLGHIIMII